RSQGSLSPVYDPREPGGANCGPFGQPRRPGGTTVPRVARSSSQAWLGVALSWSEQVSAPGRSRRYARLVYLVGLAVTTASKLTQAPPGVSTQPVANSPSPLSSRQKASTSIDTALPVVSVRVTFTAAEFPSSGGRRVLPLGDARPG